MLLAEKKKQKPQNETHRYSIFLYLEMAAESSRAAAQAAAHYNSSTTVRSHHAISTLLLVRCLMPPAFLSVQVNVLPC